MTVALLGTGAAWQQIKIELLFLQPRRSSTQQDNCHPEHKPCDFKGEVEGSVKAFNFY